MLHPAAALDASDVVRLAGLHESTMPGSVFARTGAGVLKRYYQWIVNSPTEHLFVVRHNGRVAGAAVLSFAPTSLLRRFALRSPMAFGVAVLSRFLRDGVFRTELRAYLREQLSGDTAGQGVPELVQIFVDPSERRRSIGSDLLVQVAEAARAHGAAAYQARTLRNGNEQVLEFYMRRGFRREREVRFCGVPYLLLRCPTAGGAG
jgi:GNAT superfamily N-acetyltransferase